MGLRAYPREFTWIGCWVVKRIPESVKNMRQTATSIIATERIQGG
jgi:hypothetical protein